MATDSDKDVFLELGNPAGKDWLATLIAISIFVHGILGVCCAWLCEYKVRILIEPQKGKSDGQDSSIKDH